MWSRKIRILDINVKQIGLSIKIQRRIGNFLKMNYLNQAEATNIDLDLFNEYKFSVDQLMELAGLSCAHAVQKCFPPGNLSDSRILVCVGPGNNGGDGLVAARHLTLMGYTADVYYPIKTDKELYRNLIHQCKSYNIVELNACPTVEEVNSKYKLILDGLFGFSFRPPVRSTFTDIMDVLYSTTVPIASIDIPSGWNVEDGPTLERNIAPKLLISLTAPKLCAKHYKGEYHYLGGRFVPPPLAEKYKLNLIQYPGTETCVKIV